MNTSLTKTGTRIKNPETGKAPSQKLSHKGVWLAALIFFIFTFGEITQTLAQGTKDTTPPNLIVAGPDTTLIEVTATALHPVPAPTVISANDVVDGNLIGSVTNDASKVTTNILGFYTITYSVSDLSGNKATVYRYVDIIDTIAPAIRLLGSNPDTIEVHTAYVDAGVTESDNYWGVASLNHNLKITSNIDTAKIGTYTVTYNVKDSSGNQAKPVVRTVVVMERNAPKVMLNGVVLDSVEVNTKYNDPGVTIKGNYYSASSMLLTISGSFYAAYPDGKPTVLGSYTIIYTVTDGSGNKASVERILLVYDNIPPVVTLLGSATVTTCQNSIYTDAGYAVSDNYNSIPAGITVTAHLNNSLAAATPSDISAATRYEGIYNIRYEAVDGSGNIGWSPYRYVLVEPLTSPLCKNAASGLIDTTVCKGSCPYFTAPVSGAKYKWSTGDTTQTIQFCPKNDTAITVRIIAGSDTSTYLYGIYVTSTSCVWPGDANGDGIADNNDVLAIGVAYADSGAKRSGATINWTGQPCNDWLNSFKSGANHKNADCNGDGSIDSTDMAAITKNYGLKHSKTAAANGSPTDPPLSIAFSKDSATAGDTVLATLNLGTANNPVTNAYGLAFSVNYATKYVKPGMSIANFSNCWLGTPGKNLIYFVYNDTVNGMLNIGITRTDHKNITGYGQLGTLSIVMQDNVGGKAWIDRNVIVTLNNVKMISANETVIPLYALPDSIGVAYNHATGINNILPDNAVHLYPNPVSESMVLNAGNLLINEVKIMNMVGQVVYVNKVVGLNKAEIPAAQLAPGVYSIMIATKNGSLVKTFVKE